VVERGYKITKRKGGGRGKMAEGNKRDQKIGGKKSVSQKVCMRSEGGGGKV